MKSYNNVSKLEYIRGIINIQKMKTIFLITLFRQLDLNGYIRLIKLILNVSSIGSTGTGIAPSLDTAIQVAI